MKDDRRVSSMGCLPVERQNQKAGAERINNIPFQDALSVFSHGIPCAAVPVCRILIRARNGHVAAAGSLLHRRSRYAPA
jgi:hypothetical protein